MNDGATREPAALDRIVAVDLDPLSLGGAAADVAHERAVAARDLVDVNRFAPRDRAAGSWRLSVALIDHRLGLTIAAAPGEHQRDGDGDTVPLRLSLPLAQLRRLIRDYYETCDSYYAAVRTAPAETVAAIDGERRILHDRGAALIADRLTAMIDLDTETARRLFTLVATLFWKG